MTQKKSLHRVWFWSMDYGHEKSFQRVNEYIVPMNKSWLSRSEYSSVYPWQWRDDPSYRTLRKKNLGASDIFNPSYNWIQYTIVTCDNVTNQTLQNANRMNLDFRSNSFLLLTPHISDFYSRQQNLGSEV
jgi:hypothetical protein